MASALQKSSILIAVLLLLAACKSAGSDDTVLDSAVAFAQPVVAEIPAPPAYRLGIYVTLDARLDATPPGREFLQALEERFGLTPDTYIAWYYDAVYLLADIWRQQPDARGEALSQLIRQSVFDSVQGSYCFDADGEGFHAITLAQMENGQAEPVGIFMETGLLVAVLTVGVQFF